MKNPSKKDNYKNKKDRQGGQAMITAVIFFLTISIVILVAMSVPVASQIRNGADFLQSKQGYIAADSLNEEALYRLNKGKTLPSTLVLAFSSSTSTASIITDSSGNEEVITKGVSGNFTRGVESIFSQSGGLSITYGLEVGNGGLTMSGSPTITGNVYANGNISGSGVSTITGSAIAASATSQNADQSNGASSTPAVNLTFGTTTASQDLAQSFTVSTSTATADVSFYLKKNGTPANATVSIVADKSGSPSTTIITSGTLSAGMVNTTYGWVDVGFTTNPSLTPGTTYWLVINNPSNSTTNTYTIGVSNNNSYSGQLKLGQSGGSWTVPNSSYDAFFQLYLGGVSSISGVTVGSGGSGNAQAFNVTNSTVSGNLYCQVGSGNNKSCDTSQVTPSYLSYPYSSATISGWEAAAAAGGTYNGNMTLGGVTATTTGPLKINGNLALGSSAQLTVAGTLYVTGNLTVDGASTIKLAPSYGASSGIIVVDGTVEISASGSVSGSGTTGSYILIASNSTCGNTTTCGGTSAVTISGAAGAVVLLAQNGAISFTGSAGAKAAVGYSLNINGSSNLTYDSGLGSIKFANSTSSSAWSVSNWQEVVQ